VYTRCGRRFVSPGNERGQCPMSRNAPPVHAASFRLDCSASWLLVRTGRRRRDEASRSGNECVLGPGPRRREAEHSGGPVQGVVGCSPDRGRETPIQGRRVRPVDASPCSAELPCEVVLGPGQRCGWKAVFAGPSGAGKEDLIPQRMAQKAHHGASHILPTSWA